MPGSAALLGAYALVGGVAGRIAGGWRPFLGGLLGGTQKGRFLMALVFGAALAAWPAAHGHLVLGAQILGLCALATFVGEFLPHKLWQPIGAPLGYGGSNSIWLVLIAALFGVLQVALLLAPLAWLAGDWGWLEWAGLGAWQAPAYLIGRHLPWPFLTLGEKGMVDAPTAWGEILARAGFLAIAGHVVMGIWET